MDCPVLGCLVRAFSWKQVYHHLRAHLHPASGGEPAADQLVLTIPRAPSGKRTLSSLVRQS